MEKLEQLRALEAGMTIAVARISAAPGGVDTKDDLTAARRRLGRRSTDRHHRDLPPSVDSSR